MGKLGFRESWALADALKTGIATADDTAQATVTRIDQEGRVWAHLAGGADETPIEDVTTQVSVGDSVTVRVRNGRASTVGNLSDPSAGTSYVDGVNDTAIRAASDAATAAAAAQSAVESAGTAASAAASALESAQDAQDAATLADLHAAQASADAAAASTAAATANTAAAGALMELSAVQDVMGTVNWITQHGTYALTTDTAIDPDKVYWVADATSPTGYSVVAEPDAAALSTYYELSVDAALSNYVASHLALTNDGLWVMKDGSAYRVLVASDRVEIRDGSGNTVASFGSDIEFDSSRPHVIGNASSNVTWDGTNLSISADSISLTSGGSVATTADVDAAKVLYGTCATGGSTAAKTVTLTSGAITDTTPTVGTLLNVTFTNGNGASGPTITVGSATARNVSVGGVICSQSNYLVIRSASQVMFRFDGTYWDYVSGGNDTLFAVSCGTSAATAGKTVTMPAGSVVRKGTRLKVAFTYANTASTPRIFLDNGSGWYTTIYIRENGDGAWTGDYNWAAGDTVTFEFTGQYFVPVTDDAATVPALANLSTSITQTNATIDARIDSTGSTALVRLCSAGVLVGQVGDPVCSLVDTTGAHKAVQVTWTNGEPTVGATVAEFGANGAVIYGEDSNVTMNIDDSGIRCSGRHLPVFQVNTSSLIENWREGWRGNIEWDGVTVNSSGYPYVFVEAEDADELYDDLYDSATGNAMIWVLVDRNYDTESALTGYDLKYAYTSAYSTLQSVISSVGGFYLICDDNYRLTAAATPDGGTPIPDLGLTSTADAGIALVGGVLGAKKVNANSVLVRKMRYGSGYGYALQVTDNGADVATLDWSGNAWFAGGVAANGKADLQSSNITDGTAVSSTTAGAAPLRFLDSAGTLIGALRSHFTASSQGVQLYAQRVVNGANKYNILRLGIDASGNPTVDLTAADKAAWLEALGLKRTRTTGTSVYTMSNGTLQYACADVCGGVCQLYLQFTLTSALAANATRGVGTVAAGYRPASIGAIGGLSTIGQITSAGVVTIRNTLGASIAAGTVIYCTATYLLA